MEHNFKIGDKIRILRKPNVWDGSGGKCPLDIIYPIEGAITGFTGTPNFGAVTINGYGFARNNMPKFELLSSELYEIF